jgi:hypothetical protein
MKIFKAITQTVLFPIIFISCTHKQKVESPMSDFPKTIHLNLEKASNDSLILSEIAYKIEYIPLETTDISLMGNFYNYASAKEYYFIKDELKIHRFDKNGKFINTLFKVGKGPGEAAARCFTLDELNERIYVLDHFVNDIKIFDYNGKYISSIKKSITPPGDWIKSIGYFNKCLIIPTTQLPISKYLYSYLDLANDSIRIFYKNYHNYLKTQEKLNPLVIPDDFNYLIMDTCIMFKEKFCDTIFKVNKKFVIEPRYIIDLKNRKLTWESWRDHGMFNLEAGLPHGYWVQSFAETNNSLFMVLKSFREPELFVNYTKKTDSVQIFSNKFFERPSSQVYIKNDLDRVLPFPPMDEDGLIFYSNNCMFSIVEASVFANGFKSISNDKNNLTKYLKNMATEFSSITEYSNPVIMKVYLK